MIPEAAVEAATDAFSDATGDLFEADYIRGIMQAALEAAAPHMLRDAKADAWEEGILAADYAATGYPDNPYRPTP